MKIDDLYNIQFTKDNITYSLDMLRLKTYITFSDYSKIEFFIQMYFKDKVKKFWISDRPMCFHYNYNPIARRVLFVKYSDSTSLEEFAEIKGELKRFEELNEQEKKYYEYTCRPEDVIRMCTIPSPRMTDEDLVIEKKILELQ